jgi:hypothetical protein
LKAWGRGADLGGTNSGSRFCPGYRASVALRITTSRVALDNWSLSEEAVREL